MNTKIFTTYIEALGSIVQTIRERKVSLDIRHVVIVPDNYTLYVERELYKDCKGAFDCGVTTFNRLLDFLGLERQAKILSKQAAIVLIKRICYRHKGTLAAFYRSATFSGFSQKIYDTILQFKHSNITPAMLRESVDKVYEGLGIKISDIALIYDEYQNELADRFVDEGDRYRLIQTAIMTTNIANNTHFYITNFDVLSRAMTGVVEALDSKALSTTVSSIMGGVERKHNIDNLEIYAAIDKVDQIKAVARRISVNIADGLRYSDIGVVYRGNPTVLRRIFEEWAIPVNIDTKYELATFPLSRYINSLIDICTNGINKDSMIGLAKNFLAALSKREILAFVNYTSKYAIDYKGFEQPFEYEKDNVAETARHKLITAIQRFVDVVWSAQNGVEFCSKLDIFITAMANDIIALDSRVAQDIDAVQVANKIIGIVEMLGSVIDSGDTKMLAVECFVEALSTSITLLPTLYDAVSVGSEELLRGVSKRVIYICDFNEGVLPSVCMPNGIISDIELEALSSVGAQIEPLVRDINALAKRELNQIIYSGADVVCLYIASQEFKPSFMLDTLCRRASNIIQSRLEDELMALDEAEHIKSVAPAIVARSMRLHLSTEVAASELVLGNQIKSHNYLSNIFWALQSVGSDLSRYIYRRDIADYQYNTRQLFFGSGTVSTSRIETFYTCPFRHFARYGLGIKPPILGSVAAVDIGGFLHRVLEDYVKMGQNVVVDDIIRAALEDKQFYKLSLDNNALIRDRAIKESRKICNIVSQQLGVSDFVPVGTEVKFGKACEIGSVELDGVYLEGIIDRIDGYDEYIRLIDYKSGNIQFEYTDIFTGKKLQLVAYLMILIGSGKRAAGSFYFPIRDEWDDGECSHKLKGIYNNRFDIAMHMDNTLSSIDENTPSHKSNVFDATSAIDKATGQMTLASNKHGLDERVIGSLGSYGIDMIRQGVRHLLNGEIAMSPLVLKGKSTCDYCDYVSVCNSRRIGRDNREISKGISLAMFIES